MTGKEISELYIRLAFYYESAIGALLAKRLIDEALAAATKERFYYRIYSGNKLSRHH